MATDSFGASQKYEIMLVVIEKKEKVQMQMSYIGEFQDYDLI